MDAWFILIEEVPRLAGFLNNVLVTVEDGVGEFVFAQILPDVFHAVEFGRVARQADQGDIAGHDEAIAAVIPCAIKENCGMGTGAHHLADGVEMQPHDLGIGFGRDDGCSNGAAWASGSEEIGPTVALIPRRAWAGSAFGPDAGQGALLADAGFVLEPDFDWLATGLFGERRSQRFGKVF